MSYRPLFNKLLEATKLRQLLSSKNPMKMRSLRQASNIKIRRPWLNPSILSPTMVMRYWETIPLVTFALGGLTCEFLWTLRLACTRDDVCYFGKPPFEDYTRIKKNQPPPIKKLMPLFAIVGAAVLGLGYAIVRNGLTRDDVRFYSGGKTNSEDIENWGPRKFLVFNQKYGMPKGLKEALAALEEPLTENESETVKKSK